MSNNGDKRSVSTDALETLGTIITDNEKRDAIHLAVIPAVAKNLMVPGTDVGLDSDGLASNYYDNKIGIVDPFLKAPVQAGEHFWLVIYPRKITSLRHVWTHPDIPDVPEVISQVHDEVTVAVTKAVQYIDHERWIRDWLIDSGQYVSYEEFMEAVQRDECDSYLTIYGSDAHGSIPAEVYYHAEQVLGTTLTNRPSYFSCSC